MNPLEAQKLSYLRAQASVLRSSGLSIQEISKLLEESECMAVKWSSRAPEDFEGKSEVVDLRSEANWLKKSP